MTDFAEGSDTPINPLPAVGHRPPSVRMSSEDLELGKDDIITEISKRVSAELASQVAAQVLIGSGGDGSGGGSPKTFLGQDAKSWGGWVVKGAVIVVASAIAWYTYVNDAIKVRPTKAEAAASASAFVQEHESHGRHASTAKLLEAHGLLIKQQSDVQIRQTTLMETQAATMEHFREDLRKHRHHR